MIHDEAIDRALDAWYRNPHWRAHLRGVEEECQAAMRRAIAAYCRARAKELTAESFSRGEATHAANLDSEADDLEAAQGQSE